MITKSLVIACLTALTALAQSSGSFVTGAMYVVQSASRRTAQTPASGFAPGTLCEINVTGLYQQFGGSLMPDDTVKLRLRAPGATDARDLTIVATSPAFFGQPTQFTARIPTDATPGQADLLAVAGSGKSYSTTVWIASSGFGIFTKTGAGYDAAAAQIYGDPLRTAGLTTPVRAGEWITLWGTGLGAGASTALVDVGGIVVAPAYAGPAPGFPGVDQINFRFPVGVPDDCYIPLKVKVGDRASNTTSIAAASAPGICRHRFGLTSDALAKLDQGGRVPVSQSWVHSDVIPNPGTPVAYRRYDTVSLDFMEDDAARVQVIAGLLSTKASGCQLNLEGGLTAAIFDANSQPFEAGTPVVAGPGGVRLTMDGNFGHYSITPADTSYTLAAIPPSAFATGDWALETAGGKDVAAFHAALRVPPPLRWINRAAVSPVSRESDLTLKWDASGYTDQEWMQGSVGLGQGSVICQTAATAGSITIPAALIAQLPAPTSFAPMVQLLLTPASANPMLYTVPLVAGGSIPGVATFSYLEAVSVEMTPVGSHWFE